MEENPYKAPGVPQPSLPWRMFTGSEVLAIVLAVVLNALLLWAQIVMCGLAPAGDK